MADNVPATEQTDVPAETETKDIPAKNDDTGFDDKPAIEPDQVAE